MKRLPVLLNSKKSKRLVSIGAYCHTASQTHLLALLLNVQMKSQKVATLHAG
jgi:hypothetical protein